MPEKLTDVPREVVIRELLKLDDSDMMYVAIMIEILRNDHGCFSPPEEFIQNLLIIYKAAPAGLTPKSVESDLAEFRSNFDDMAAGAIAMGRRCSAVRDAICSGHPGNGTGQPEQ